MDLINPWADTPEKPDFVLPQDEARIRDYNKTLSETDFRRINLRHTPEPRLGPIDAPVYTLQANPSYDRKNPAGDPQAHRIAEELASIRDHSAPHLGIVRKERWWNASFAQLLRDKVSRDQAAASICSVELSPYRSLRFGHAALQLPSQAYTVALVNRAIQQGKIIIVTRSLRSWCAAVPALAGQLGVTVSTGRNPRRVFISPGNLTLPVYERVRDAILRNTGAHR